jgi:hypothetical protein
MSSFGDTLGVPGEAGLLARLAQPLRGSFAEVTMKRAHAVVVFLCLAVLGLGASPASAQLTLDWMVPAAANSPGLNGTDWHTDLSLHNPHVFDLPVVIQFLPTETVNTEADTILLTLGPWQTVNLWDVLGAAHFAVAGSGALLVYADHDLLCDPVSDCEFLVTSRTYTLNPSASEGEFGQTLAGAPSWQGVDWATLGYAAGLLNDGVNFRANVGIASWSSDWTSVVVDVQSAEGDILESFTYRVPPYGHLQRRLPTLVEGGSLVFWLDDGPANALIWGYVSVVDQLTGDASFQLAQPSTVGFAAAAKGRGTGERRSVPRPRQVVYSSRSEVAGTASDD